MMLPEHNFGRFLARLRVEGAEQQVNPGTNNYKK